MLGGGGIRLGEIAITERLGIAWAVALTQTRGKDFLTTHPASAEDGAHTQSQHLLGFSAALAPKFTHTLTGAADLQMG